MARVSGGADAERFCSREIDAELSIVMNGQETLGQIRPRREHAFPTQTQVTAWEAPRARARSWARPSLRSGRVNSEELSPFLFLFSVNLVFSYKLIIGSNKISFEEFFLWVKFTNYV